MTKRLLILEDGTFFEGKAFGASVEKTGEVVFNTGMTGYQEILTDPSYCDQIVCLTYPLIGNYGINRDDFESIKPSVHGLIVKEACDTPSNFRSQMTLHKYLEINQIPGIMGIDTRKLTRLIRSHERQTMQWGCRCPCDCRGAKKYEFNDRSSFSCINQKYIFVSRKKGTYCINGFWHETWYFARIK